MISSNSFIFTNHGPMIANNVSISKISLGVLNIHNNEKIYSTITKCKPVDKVELYRVITDNGFSIDCSDITEIYTKNGFKKIKDLSLDDEVLTCEKYNIFNNSDRPLYSIKALCYFLTSSSWTEINRGIRFTFSNQYLQEDFIKNQAYISQDGMRQNNNRFILSGNSKRFYKNAFASTGKIVKIIPNWVFFVPETQLEKAIGLWFSIAGNISQRDNYAYLCVDNLYLAKQIKFILNKLGINSKYKYFNNGHKLKIIGGYNLNKFYLKISKYIIVPSKLELLNLLKLTKINISEIPEEKEFNFSKIQSIRNIVGLDNTFMFGSVDNNSGIIDGILLRTGNYDS